MNNKLRRTILLTLLVAIVAAQTSIIYAAPSPVGVVNYQYLVQNHPDVPQAQEAYNAALKQAQSDFDAKSSGMNDQDKKALLQQYQQEVQKKQQELLSVIREKVNVAIKAVADAKGLFIVIDKNVTVYGGQDITDEVMKKITGK